MADTYTVKLTATNAIGSGSEEKTAYNTVTIVPASRIGIFRPSAHRLSLDMSEDGKWGAGDSQYEFGLAGDMPVSGKWS